MSVTQPEEKTSSLDSLKLLFGSDSLIEGFKEGMTGEQEEKQHQDLEKMFENEKKQLIWLNDASHLGENGKATTRKLIKKIMKQRRDVFRKYCYFFAFSGQQNMQNMISIIKVRDFYEKIVEDYEKAIEGGGW